MPKDYSTEQKILDAAEEVFHDKGYDGARMQEIAEFAGINKGLLHYYFQTKDKLFEAIFSVALNKMLNRIQVILELDKSLEEKIELMVEQYMGVILRNPSLPRFVITELNKNPERFVARHFNKDAKNAFAAFSKSVQREVDLGNIKPIDPRQLIMNIMSMIVFPFLGKPIMQVFMGTNNDEFKMLLNERKEHIKMFVKDAIRK